MSRKRAIIDLLVIGADAAGVAAAACAAKGGAMVAVAATGGEAPAAGSTPPPPNFVWRLLDLHCYALKAGASSRRTTLAEDAALPVEAEPTKAAATLGRRDATLEHLWPAFLSDMKRRDAAAQLGDDRHLSANALLDDYFSDELLKTHLVSAYVAPFGLAGDEAGSAAALKFAGRAAPAHLSARALLDALEDASKKAGVEFPGGRLQSFARGDAKSWRALFDNGREIRARCAMASSAAIGEAAGLRIACGASPLLRRSGTEAVIRIRYEKRPNAAALKAGGACFTASSRDDIRRAFDAMLDGAILEQPLVSFEAAGKEIVAHAPFCPARLRENGDERDWTGQDRQILGRNVAALIASRLGGDVGAVHEIEVTIGADVASGLKRRSFEIDAIPAPSPSPDPIGAAAHLAMEMTRHG